MVALLGHSLWILGLACLVATGSWAWWESRITGRGLRAVLARPGLQRWLALGCAGIGLGLSLLPSPAWERALWSILGACGVFLSIRMWRRDPSDDPPSGEAHGPARAVGPGIGGWAMRGARSLRRWGVGIGIAALSIGWLIREVDWRGTAQALRAADYRWVLVGALAIAFTLLARARRWQALLHPTAPPLRTVMMGLLLGQLFNQALPMRGGDVARVLWLSPTGREAPAVIGSVVVEKLWDLLALLVCILALLAWTPLPEWLLRAAGPAALMAGGCLLGLGTILRQRERILSRASGLVSRLPSRWQAGGMEAVRRGLEGLAAACRPRVAGQALGWTGLTWLGGGLANLAVLTAFGFPHPPAALFLLIALMIGGAVPVPARVGLFEGICVVSLGLFGVDPERALAVGLILHGVVMGPPLAAAAFLALWPPSDRRRRHAHP
jgi:uncharacterized protein (TIRG00374 family)